MFFYIAGTRLASHIKAVENFWKVFFSKARPVITFNKNKLFLSPYRYPVGFKANLTFLIRRRKFKAVGNENRKNLMKHFRLRKKLHILIKNYRNLSLFFMSQKLCFLFKEFKKLTQIKISIFRLYKTAFITAYLQKSINDILNGKSFLLDSLERSFQLNRVILSPAQKKVCLPAYNSNRSFKLMGNVT